MTKLMEKTETDQKRWAVGDSASLEHVFTQDDVDRFVALTGDDNPMHIDQDYAAQTEIGGCVVHGMLAASFVSTLIGTKLPGPGALWLSFAVNWKNPIRVNAKVEIQAVITSITKATQTMDLDISAKDKSSGKIYLEAKATVMDMGKKKL